MILPPPECLFFPLLNSDINGTNVLQLQAKHLAWGCNMPPLTSMGKLDRWCSQLTHQATFNFPQSWHKALQHMHVYNPSGCIIGFRFGHPFMPRPWLHMWKRPYPANFTCQIAVVYCSENSADRLKLIPPVSSVCKKSTQESWLLLFMGSMVSSKKFLVLQWLSVRFLELHYSATTQNCHISSYLFISLGDQFVRLHCIIRPRSHLSDTHAASSQGFFFFCMILWCIFGAAPLILNGPPSAPKTFQRSSWYKFWHRDRCN